MADTDKRVPWYKFERSSEARARLVGERRVPWYKFERSSEARARLAGHGRVPWYYKRSRKGRSAQ